MAQLDQDLFKEVTCHYFHRVIPSHVNTASNKPQKWSETDVKEREKFGLVSRRHYYGMLSLLSEFSSINFYTKENPTYGYRQPRASFQKISPLKKPYKKLRTFDGHATEGYAKDRDGEILINPKFVPFFTRIFQNKKWYVDIPALGPNDKEVIDSIKDITNLYYISLINPISEIFYDRLKSLFKKNLATLKHFDGISGIDYSRIIPEEVHFETCYVQCKPNEASDRPVLPQVKTKTFLLEGTTLTGFLFQKTTAEKFVIESTGFKRFFEKFASYLSSVAQSMEMDSVQNRNLKSIILKIDQWFRDDVPYFGMFLKELMTYFPNLEKLTIKLDFIARVFGSNWNFGIVNTRGLASFESYFNDFKRLVELYWFEMMKFEHIPFKVDFDTKFHYESIYDKFPLPNLTAIQRVFQDWNVQETDPSSVQVIQEKYQATAKSCYAISKHMSAKNFDYKVHIKVVSLEASKLIWSIIEEGLKDVFYECKDANKKYIKIYAFCYEFLTFCGMERSIRYSSDCHNTVGYVMYDYVRRFITEQVEGILSTCRHLSEEELLTVYSDLWKRFEYGADLANGIFSYLNRHWIKRAIEDRNENVHEISHLAKIIWRRNLFEHIRLNLETAILNKAKNPEFTDFEQVYKQIDEIFGFDSIGFDQIVIQAAIGFVMKHLQYSNVNSVAREVGQLLTNRIANLDNLFMFCLRSLIAKDYLRQAEDEEGVVISLA